MAKYGRTIFYDKGTGAVLYDSQEIEITINDYAPDYYAFVPALKNREKESIEEIKFDFGAYAEDFAEGAYVERIDLKTKEPLFIYPEIKDPETPPVPQAPLSERLKIAEAEVKRLNAADLDNKEMLNGIAAIVFGG